MAAFSICIPPTPRGVKSSFKTKTEFVARRVVPAQPPRRNCPVFRFNSAVLVLLASRSDTGPILPVRTQDGITYVYDPSLNAMRPKSGQPAAKEVQQPARADLKATLQRAAQKAIDRYVQDGMVVGFGAGSTINFALDHFAALFKAGRLRDVTVVPHTAKTMRQAESFGLPIRPFDDVPSVDICFDGADEVDPQVNLVKGRAKKGGGGGIRHKLVESTAGGLVVIVDESKLVPWLGKNGFVAVEVVPFGWTHTLRKVLKGIYGTGRVLLGPDGEPLVTDSGNYLLGLDFAGPAAHIREVAAHIEGTTGVVGSGLFIDACTAAIVAAKDGSVYEFRRTNLANPTHVIRNIL